MPTPPLASGGVIINVQGISQNKYDILFLSLSLIKSMKYIQLFGTTTTIKNLENLNLELMTMFGKKSVSFNFKISICRLRYSSKGFLTIAGFSEPLDADADDIELWFPQTPRKSTDYDIYCSHVIF